jgi:ATP-binding protein involved in chromosome partitioning
VRRAKTKPPAILFRPKGTKLAPQYQPARRIIHTRKAYCFIMITQDSVRFALSNVIEPDLGRDLIELNMVEDILIRDTYVSFTVVLTTPACPMKDHIRTACENAIKHLVDKNAVVDVQFTSRVTTVQPPKQEGNNIGNIVAVASGKGGVGKSTVAVNLAIGLAKTSAKVGLLDLDIYGPSIPTMFGQKETPNITAQRRLIPLEKFGVKTISMGYIVNDDQAVIWRGPMVTKAVQQFFNDVEWGDLDYLILDLPPGTGDIQLTLVQTIPLTGALIVSTPQEVALADARKGVAMFNKVSVPILGMVENMAFFTTEDVPGKKYYIFGQGGARRLAAELNVPFLGEIPLEEVVRSGGDTGNPVVVAQPESASAIAFMQLTNRTAQQISMRNANMPPTKRVEITRV